MLHFLGLVPEEYLSSAKCSSCHYAGMPGKLVTQVGAGAPDTVGGGKGHSQIETFNQLRNPLDSIFPPGFSPAEATCPR